ncbi:MAG: hypothetical protein K8S99_18250 [Planctomycetes bacterium]|nr:hypothetical protein [Planctomycetota bacterium]
MQCNIDAKGKAARLISGFVTLLAGIILAVLAVTGVFGGTWIWIVATAALAGGAFQIYEGWAGWCVVRAMGFKTPV